MTPFSKLLLDTEHLKEEQSRSPLGSTLSWPENAKESGELETTNLLRKDSAPFADVPLADTPRCARSIAGITRTSASNTPSRPIQPPQAVSRTPSPGPRPARKPPLQPSSHRRQPSDVSTSVVSESAAPALSDSARTSVVLSGELPERLSWGSEDARLACNGVTGAASLSSAQAKEGVECNDDGSQPLSDSNADPLDDSPSTSKQSSRKCCSAWFSRDPLLALTVLGVLLGIGAGLALRPAKLGPLAREVLGFPGEIMLRLLKMLVLPLVAGSMVAGVCALRGSPGSMAKVAQHTLLYYASTTIAAVVLGIFLVNVIRPGRGQPLGSGDVVACSASTAAEVAEETILQPHISPLTALLGVIRSIFPENIALAAVNMNILGIITFSLFFGLALAGLGDAADPFVHGVEVFNTCIGRMVTGVLWMSPIGIASLIAASIVSACDLMNTLLALGLWVLTVLVGLGIFAVTFLPAVLWLATRKNPLTFLKQFSQAIVLAFGTSSSSAALPVAMECAKKAGCEDSIIKFVLPLGTTVNMNGTALYEATTVIFIAQAHGVSLGLPGTLVVACTATLAAIGAAAIPSAGLVTMLMVLQAVSLERFAADLAMILAIDWLLDRCRTAVNLMSDALAVVAIDHFARQQAELSYSQIEMA